MYADDTVLQWQVQRVRDLNFMCECARHTFAVLQEAGMSLNSSKTPHCNPITRLPGAGMDEETSGTHPYRAGCTSRNTY